MTKYEYEQSIMEWEMSPDNPKNYPLDQKIEYYENQLNQIESEYHCDCYEDKELYLFQAKNVKNILKELYKERRK
jgi:hypothetical protein